MHHVVAVAVAGMQSERMDLLEHWWRLRACMGLWPTLCAAWKALLLWEPGKLYTGRLQQLLLLPIVVQMCAEIVYIVSICNVLLGQRRAWD
jgi:hypothetical protein